MYISVEARKQLLAADLGEYGVIVLSNTVLALTLTAGGFLRHETAWAFATTAKGRKAMRSNEVKIVDGDDD